MKKIIYILLIASVFASCNQGDNKANEQIARNKAGMQKFYDEAMNKHNPAFMDSLIVSDFVEHENGPGTPPVKNREDLKKFFTEFISGYPDLNFKVNFMVADSDKVVTHYTFTGINSGPMMGFPATNKKVNYDGVDIVRFNKDGKGVEHWGYMEEGKMMAQLGMGPDMNSMMPPDSSKKKMDEKDKKMDDKMKKMDSKMEKAK
jgi:steroid delta-isomerase-like uncharacterized protein